MTQAEKDDYTLSALPLIGRQMPIREAGNMLFTFIGIEREESISEGFGHKVSTIQANLVSDVWGNASLPLRRVIDYLEAHPQ